MRKRILSMALAGVMSLGMLTGCGGAKEGTNSNPNQKVELNFWHGMESGENNTVLTEMVEKFNKTHPNIEVKLQGYGAADQAMGKIMVAIQGQKQPELLWFAPAFTGKFAEADVLAAAEDFMKEDSTFKKEDIYQGLWDVSSYKGKIYTVPFEANNLAVFYNKKAFQEAGITKTPETWDELAEAAKKLTVDKNKDGKIDQYGFQVPIGTNEWTVWTWQTLLWQAGGDFLNKEQNAPAFNSTQGQMAVDYWKDLVDDNYAYFSETDAGYKTDDFEAGKVAMQIIGPWTLPQLDKNKSVDYGVFFLPKKERFATNIGGENLFIFKTTKEKEKASWEFAKWIMSKEFQVEWAKKTGYLPVSKSAANSEEFKAFLNEKPNVKVFVDQMQYGFARPSIPAYNDISTQLGKQLEQALYGKISSKEALDAAAEAAKKALK